MKNATILGLSFLLTIALVGCGGKDTSMKHEKMGKMSGTETTTTEEPVIYYTCPMEMHKHVNSSEPGSCPECNMKLVAAVVTSADQMDYYGCPMKAHSHVRSDSPGKCNECGMTLKPMRLVN